MTMTKINFTQPDDYNLTIVALVPASANYSAAINTSNIIVRFSEFDWKFPDRVSNLQFRPNNLTEQNVTPFGQSDTIPIINVTSKARIDPFNISFSINATINGTQFNLTISNRNFTENFTVPIEPNRTFFETNVSNITIGGNASAWLYLDLNEAVFPISFFIRKTYLNSICYGCVRTDPEFTGLAG